MDNLVLLDEEDEDSLALIDALEQEALKKRRKTNQEEDQEKQEEGLYTAALRGSNSNLWKNSTNPSNRGAQGKPTSRTGDNFSRGGTVTVTSDGNVGTCYKCGEYGHWSRDCSVGVSRGGGGDQGVKEKACRCGAEDCLVFTANTEKNPGRKFYRCPLKEENGGCGFFEWCDTPSTGSMPGTAMQHRVLNYASDPSIPDLQCPCGAGSCLVLTSKTEKNMGKQFYRCPENQGGGSCGFFKWCSEYNPTHTPQVSRAHNDTNVPFSGGKSGSSCYKCGQEGHWSRECPNSPGPTSIDFAGRSTRNDTSSGVKSGSSCYKCGHKGHWSRDCPNPAGSASIDVSGRSTSSGTCYKCGKAGHWARDCGAQESSPGFGTRKSQASFRTSRG